MTRLESFYALRVHVTFHYDSKWSRFHMIHLHLQSLMLHWFIICLGVYFISLWLATIQCEFRNKYPAFLKHCRDSLLVLPYPPVFANINQAYRQKETYFTDEAICLGTIVLLVWINSKTMDVKTINRIGKEGCFVIEPDTMPTSSQ